MYRIISIDLGFRSSRCQLENDIEMMRLVQQKEFRPLRHRKKTKSGMKPVRSQAFLRSSLSVRQRIVDRSLSMIGQQSGQGSFQVSREQRVLLRHIAFESR